MHLSALELEHIRESSGSVSVPQPGKCLEAEKSALQDDPGRDSSSKTTEPASSSTSIVGQDTSLRNMLESMTQEELIEELLESKHQLVISEGKRLGTLNMLKYQRQQNKRLTSALAESKKWYWTSLIR